MVGQSTTATSTGREHSRQIRAWAGTNGYPVSGRGRLSSVVFGTTGSLPECGSARSAPPRSGGSGRRDPIPVMKLKQ
ncbi:histone-like nucleoid-structuring protein Lsr2 [Amycolatopsis sp. lyj-346]|uniref:Lsr2 family DNA-binding protein n=1 Tax=Amycolatopsis sp. lyj-346 TaxID=2789289 RepID=UPI00397A4779